MKKFKKSLVLAILVAFGLSFCGVFSEGAMAAISTSLEYQGTWKEFNGSTWNEKSGTIHTNITTDYANVSCNGEHVVVRTFKVGESAEWAEELRLKCGDLVTPTEYVNGHQQAGKPVYANVSNITTQLKRNGVGIYDCIGYSNSDGCLVQITKGDKKVYVIGQKGGKAKVECNHVPAGNASDATYISTELGGGKTFKTSITEGSCDSTVETALKKAGFNVGNWNSGWYDMDGGTQTDDKKKTDTNVDDDNTKKNSGTEVDDGGSRTNDTAEDNQDPYVPKTMEYGDVDNKASILVGCDKAEQGGGEGVKCIINLVVDIMTVGVGILSVIGITVVGIQYLTSAGSEEKARKAKRRLFEIVIGVALYAVAYALLKWLLPSF